LIKDRNVVLNIKMEPSKETALDEVTITATGPQKKVTVTGAITTVETSTLKTPVSSITNALAGNVAGVLAMQRSGQPGSNTSEFWIRGISTFGGSSSALVLVDGFERSLDELNIEDIQDFSVLKDASATAIYGSRGANGVILITTKRGADAKVDINVKAEYTWTTRTMTPKFADGLTYASMANEAMTTRNKNGHLHPTGAYDD
jgi:TonB-dependent outer membrane receptor, SusC/RagA subfamily, signature region